MTDNEKILKNLDATFAIENLKASEYAKANVLDFLDGKITSEEAINNILKKYKDKFIVDND